MKRLLWVEGLVSFLLILILGLFFPAEAGFLKRPLSFQNITAKDGLSSEMIFAIAVQGEEVWFGTYAGGTTLYDRSKKVFKTFTTKGEPQEKDDGVSIKWKNHPAYNHVSVILPDKDRIWFGTYFYGFGGGGISYYNPKRKNPWRPFNTNKDVAKKIARPGRRRGTCSGLGRKKAYRFWIRRPRNGKLFTPLRTAWRVILSTPFWFNRISSGPGPMGGSAVCISPRMPGRPMLRKRV